MYLEEFKASLSGQEIGLFESFRTPADIQAFLDGIPYSTSNENRSPVQVLHDRVAHCLDGALFAAAALRWMGFDPILIDMFPEPGQDDDHVLAIFRRGGYLGAVAKSNFAGLRFREAIYRTPRELVLTYFDAFFNLYGQKTLRFYTRPYNLQKLDPSGWMWSIAGADRVEKTLYGLKRIPIFPSELAAFFTPVDQLSFRAGMLGTDPDGLYKPKKQP